MGWSKAADAPLSGLLRPSRMTGRCQTPRSYVVTPLDLWAYTYITLDKHVCILHFMRMLKRVS